MGRISNCSALFLVMWRSGGSTRLVVYCRRRWYIHLYIYIYILMIWLSFSVFSVLVFPTSFALRPRWRSTCPPALQAREVSWIHGPPGVQGRDDGGGSMPPSSQPPTPPPPVLPSVCSTSTVRAHSRRKSGRSWSGARAATVQWCVSMVAKAHVRYSVLNLKTIAITTIGAQKALR